MTEKEKLVFLLKHEAIAAFNSHFVTPFEYNGEWYVERMGLSKNTYYKVLIQELGTTFEVVPPEACGYPQDRGGV